jgi:phage protein D
MEHERFQIDIDGEEAGDLYPDILSLEVELDDELAGMFRLRLALPQEADGTWRYLDDERLTVWKEVAIAAGFASGTEELMLGTITHVRPSFDPDPSKCTLEIWGMDGSVLLDREEKLKDWPNKKDSDIASEIFNEYGLTPEVENTEVVHDEAISTVIQRETDMQFLKRLALRNGFDCYVEGTRGYFRPPAVDAEPQPVLALHFGAETNVNRFSLEVNALSPANVTMFQVDRLNKEILEAAAESSLQTPLGDTDANGLLADGMNPGQVYMRMNVATGNPEMIALCQGVFHQAEWFVSGEGEIAAAQYGHVLRPRGTVTIKGIGETYSGLYYVSHATHILTPDGYTQSFRVKRNGLKPTRDTSFVAGNGNVLGGLL